MSCGQCAIICPTGAINHQNFPESKIHPIKSYLDISTEQVLELIRRRRSIRAFQNKKIPKEAIEKVIDASNFAQALRINKQPDT